jgi:hypothetical protein
MILSTFHPRETDRFKFCCGGYRRWELIEDGAEWWWRLASDWGLAHVADALVPIRARLDLQLDVSRVDSGSCPGHGTVSLCSRIRISRLGIDGLPFRGDVSLSVQLERGRLRLNGPDLVQPGVWPLDERYWNEGAVDLSVERSASEVQVRINGDEVARASLSSANPALILLSANSAGMPEAGTRFGRLTVTRL